MTSAPDPAADGQLRDLITRAVAPHLRPSMECEPHPDETAIVDSVLAAVAPLIKAPHEPARCALQATHPWLHRLYGCNDTATRTVVMPIVTAAREFRGEALQAEVCDGHARHLATVYGAHVEGLTPGDTTARQMEQLHASIDSMGATLRTVKKAIDGMAATLKEGEAGA